MSRSRRAPPLTRIEPRARFQRPSAAAARRRKEAPRFSAARLARAPATLTKEIPTLTRDDRVASGVEARVGAGLRGAGGDVRRLPLVRGGGRARAQPLARPSAVGVEGTVEDSREVDLVARPLGTEVAARRRAGDLTSRGVDLDLGEVVGFGAAAGVDQNARVRGAGESEARHPGARGCGQVDVDRGASHGVEA